jgi:hypothetical protein
MTAMQPGDAIVETLHDNPLSARARAVELPRLVDRCAHPTGDRAAVEDLAHDTIDRFEFKEFSDDTDNHCG